MGHMPGAVTAIPDITLLVVDTGPMAMPTVNAATLQAGNRPRRARRREDLAPSADPVEQQIS